MSFRKVLIAVDGSPVAARAAEVGAELARSLGVPAAEIIALAEQDGKKLLEQLRQRAGGTPPPLAFATVGKPAHEIVKAGKDWPADVIVIGSHGRRGVKRVLLGSVAEGVMRHAPCPVLVIRAPE